MPYPRSASRRVGRAVAWSVALTMGAVLVRELVRPRPERARLIDWEGVEEIALRRCGEAPGVPVDPTQTQAYATISAELRPILAEALSSGQARTGDDPPLEAIGRREWVTFNVRIFRRMFQPVERLEDMVPSSLALELGRRGLTRYLGLMLGLLARRVLGQYDPALLGREPVQVRTLVLVEPNVRAWSQRDQLPLDELRRWLAMHEMTHAWEFAAHPWLQAHLERLLKEVLLGRLADGHRPTPLELLRTLTIGMGQQWRAISQLQAAMCLLEGYCNLVMNEVGRRQLPHFALLEHAYHRRLQQRTALERLFLRLTGMEMKMKQYQQGERFCRLVTESAGASLLALAWRGPEWLPSMAEIQRPQLWIDRVRQAA